MMVILGQSDHIALRRDLEATAATHFDVGALKLPNEGPIALKYSHMEAVSVAVSNKDVPCITDVDAIGIVSDVLTANAAHELAVFIEHHHTVALWREAHIKSTQCT